MNYPSDKEFMQLQKDVEQRRLMCGGRSFLVFGRVVLFAFLAVGVIFLLVVCWRILHSSEVPDARALYFIVFPFLWNLTVLSLIRLISTQLATIKREEQIE